MLASGPASEKFCTVSQNSRFTAPRPKKEMWREPVHPAFEAAVTAEPVFAVEEQAEHHAGDKAEQNPEPGEEKIWIRFHLISWN